LPNDSLVDDDNADGVENARVHVVFPVRSLEAGGAEAQFALLARRLNPKKFQATVVCFYPHGPLRASLEQDGIPVICLDKKAR